MEYEILKQRSRNLAYEVSSLKKCEDEPIAFCGAIQPSGLLVAIDSKTHLIRAISRSWESAIGQDAKLILGKSLFDFVTFTPEVDPSELCSALATGDVRVSIKNATRPVSDGTCYTVGDNLIFEFEFDDEVYRNDARLPLKNFVASMRLRDSIEEACQLTAETIKEMSGFDRVMIYRFDSDWNGEVIGEAREKKLEPFLHLKYPAYDIPAQARQLFFQNHSRMIVSINQEPEPILTNGFHPGELDLSGALLRAVSPIHVQYLTNMGVTASFSAPIRVSDRLWGLIACHHYSGNMHPSSDTRYMFELAAQMTSGRVSDLLDKKRLQIKNDTLTFTQNLLAEVASGKTASEAIKAYGDKLLQFESATSTFVKIGDEEFFLGDKPGAQTIDAVRKHLTSQSNASMWQSNCLSNLLGIEPDPKAAGALAIPLSVDYEDMLIWFRPEEVQEVRWGGKPQNKESSHQNTLDRLSPRSSFAEWREKLEFHSRAWSTSDIDLAQYFQLGFVQGLFQKARALSTAYLELERVTKSKDEFIGTVSHELRTPLSIIVGWVNILKDFEQQTPEAQEAVRVIDRNAKIQIKLIDDLLDASRIIAGKLRLNLEPNVSVKEIMQNVVESLIPTAQAKSIHLNILTNNDIRIPADPDRLRQVAWNLITNAIKFTPKNGNVTLRYDQTQSSCVISVEDNGMGIDPQKLSLIFDRFAQARAQSANLGGLGLGLSIVKSIVEMHGGSIRAFSRGEGHGTKFVLTLPIYALADHTSSDQSINSNAKPASLAPRSHQLSGIKILIVEDQPDSQKALRILLERESATVATASNGLQGLDALKNSKFDLILSDVGMPEMDGLEMLRAWREEERKFNIPTIPAIALTAYATSKDRTAALQVGFQNHIAKPVDQQELIAVINSTGVKKTKA